MTGTLASRVRVRSVKILDRFASDHALCMYAASASSSARSTLLLESGFRALGARHGNLIHERERLVVSPYMVLPPPEIGAGRSRWRSYGRSATGAAAGRSAR
jgi:hypothetical protein